MAQIELTQGTVEYGEQGTGAPVVLIHGLLVNGRVWERLVPALVAKADVRCIVPELPLGSHRIPMARDADLAPTGLARLIAEVLERLELEDVTLVANDTGGALAQLVAAHHPGRIGRLVLTNCDAFENFPPPAFAPVVKGLTRVPGAVAGLAFGGRFAPVRRASMKAMPLTVQPLPDELLKAWIAPLRDRRIRRDLVRVLRRISPDYTLAAAERLKTFDRPALLPWGVRDRFFPVAEGERLAAVFPNARFERIPNARTFVQLDAPDRLAELIAEFVPARTPVPDAA
jgi:pimeloyl-ACP methyl ester carboxylesterase